MNKIRTTTYRIDDKDALIFDMVLEMERNAISNDRFKENVSRAMRSMVVKIEFLESELGRCKRKKAKE